MTQVNGVVREFHEHIHLVVESFFDRLLGGQVVEWDPRVVPLVKGVLGMEITTRLETAHRDQKAELDKVGRERGCLGGGVSGWLAGFWEASCKQEWCRVLCVGNFS